MANRNERHQERVSEVHIRIIEGDSTDKLRAECYNYLRDLYKYKLTEQERHNKTTIDTVNKGGLTNGNRNLCQGIDRRTS